jgi:hypothetical protein
MSQQAAISIFDSHVPFVGASKFELAEEDIPDSVVDLLHADVFTSTTDADVYPCVVPANAAVSTDKAFLEAIWIFQRRNTAGHGARRWRIAARRCLLVECLMRSEIVELGFEPIELALLRCQVPCRRARRLGFECAVHALMATVLLRLTGLDELGQDAQADPPGRKRRQTRQAHGGERCAVVRANARGQAVLSEDPHEYGLGFMRRRRLQRLALEQEAAVAVGNGQRIAVSAIERLELALEVSAPDLVGRVNRGVRLAGMPDRPSTAFMGDQAMAIENVVDRRPMRPGPVRIALASDRKQLLAAPGRVMSTRIQDCLDNVIRRLSGACARAPADLLKAWRPQREVAVNPFVGSLSTDAVAIAQLADRKGLAQIVRDELRFLVHGAGLTPRHGAPPQRAPLWSNCYPCLTTVLSPMYGDRTRQRPTIACSRRICVRRAAVNPRLMRSAEDPMQGYFEVLWILEFFLWASIPLSASFAIDKRDKALWIDNKSLALLTTLILFVAALLFVVQIISCVSNFSIYSEGNQTPEKLRTLLIKISCFSFIHIALFLTTKLKTRVRRIDRKRHD